jgi:hypothetical protein
VQRCVTELLEKAPLDSKVLALLNVEPDGHPWTSSHWPAEPTEAERQAVPHQILRYLNGDEYPHALIRGNTSSPVTKWLDEVIKAG